MEKIWIVVADNACARILATTARTGMPTEVARLDHPEGRLKEHELVTDQPGRSRDSLAQGHAMDEASATSHEETEFAGQVVDTLEKARQEGRFDDLILVASPHFLGKLRQKLSSPLEKLVTQSIDKNLVRESESTIQKNIFN